MMTQNDSPQQWISSDWGISDDWVYKKVAKNGDFCNHTQEIRPGTDFLVRKQKIELSQWSISLITRVLILGVSSIGFAFIVQMNEAIAQVSESSISNGVTSQSGQVIPVLPPPPSIYPEPTEPPEIIEFWEPIETLEPTESLEPETPERIENEDLTDSSNHSDTVPTVDPSQIVSPETVNAYPPDSINAATVTIEDYILGVGDRLQIEVFESPEYSGEFTVLPDGTVRMPFVDAVHVRGQTIEEASTLLSQQYASILRRPLVTMRVIETRPILLAVTGEVNRPGSYNISLSDDNQDGLPTVTKAIQIAGGITQSADIRSIQVVRNAPGNEQPPTIISVNLWQLLQESDLRQDIALQDGDRIVIPEAPIIDLNEVNEVATANFSPESITVNIVGEVGAPGAVQVPANTPLNQAILAAGGFNNRARRGKVDLVQLNPNGTVSNREIEVDLDVNTNSGNNPPLRPNDTVIVNRSTFTRITDSLARALSPVTAVFSLLSILGL